MFAKFLREVMFKEAKDLNSPKSPQVSFSFDHVHWFAHTWPQEGPQFFGPGKLMLCFHGARDIRSVQTLGNITAPQIHLVDVACQGNRIPTSRLQCRMARNTRYIEFAYGRASERASDRERQTERAKRERE